MVAADGDGVPQRHVARAVLDGVDHQPHRRLRWEDVLLLSLILLQDVVLQRAAQLFLGHALLLGRGDVHGPDDGRRAVDGHAGRHLIERDAVKEDFHIAQAADRHAALAEFAQRLRGIGVVAHQRRQVKGHGQTHVALAEQILVAGIGLLGAAEAGEHAHRPRLAAVEGGVDAARVGIFTRLAQVVQVVQVGHVERRIEPLDRFAGGGFKRIAPLRGAGQRPLQGRFFPAILGFGQFSEFGFVVHGFTPTRMSFPVTVWGLNGYLSQHYYTRLARAVRFTQMRGKRNREFTWIFLS